MVENAPSVASLDPECRRPQRPAAWRWSACIDTPVAADRVGLGFEPGGWIDRQTAILLGFQPLVAKSRPAHRLGQAAFGFHIDQFGNGEAIMGGFSTKRDHRARFLDWRKPCFIPRAASKLRMFALGHRQKSCNMLGGAEQGCARCLPIAVETSAEHVAAAHRKTSEQSCV